MKDRANCREERGTLKITATKPTRRAEAWPRSRSGSPLYQLHVRPRTHYTTSPRAPFIVLEERSSRAYKRAARSNTLPTACHEIPPTAARKCEKPLQCVSASARSLEACIAYSRIIFDETRKTFVGDPRQYRGITMELVYRIFLFDGYVGRWTDCT